MKKFLSAMLVLVLLSTMAVPIYADEFIVDDSVQVMNPTQQISEALVDIQTNSELDDAIKIQQIVTLLFDAKRSQYEMPLLNDFDFSIFWFPNSMQSVSLNCFERYVKLQKETYAVLDAHAANARTELVFENITISGTTAMVDVYEWFAYTFYSAANGLNDQESGSGIPYAITMNKVDSAWIISDIYFDVEISGYLREGNVSVEDVVEAAYHRATVSEPSIVLFSSENEQIASSRTAPIYLFDASRFVTYAKLYDGSARNPYFENIPDNDCQNFASQCVWYGLGGTNTSAAISALSAPMVSPSVTDVEWRQWYCSTAGHSFTWTHVEYFAEHITAVGSGYFGLNGTIYSGVSQAQPGDIIQISKDGGASWYHSYVVVAVTGSAGSRTTLDITVSAHTRDSVMEVLGSIVTDSNIVFRTIRITGVVCGS